MVTHFFPYSDDDIQVRDETPQQRNKDLEINPTFENIEEENKEPATPALSETFGLREGHFFMILCIPKMDFFHRF